MATEKNDNTAEYCLPTELLAKNSFNEQDYQEGKTKPRQKLKDLLLSADTDNENDTTAFHRNISKTGTQETKTTHLNNAIFNDCLHENRNITNGETSDLNTHVLNSSDTNSSNTRCFKLENNPSTTDSNTYGPNLSNQGHNNSELESAAASTLKLQRNDSLTAAESFRGGRRASYNNIEKVFSEEERFYTPGICEDASEYVFQDPPYDTAISTRFDNEDEWEMAISTRNSPSPVSINACNKPIAHTLFIKQAGTTDTLRQQIAQIVGGSQMTVLSLEESFDVGTKAEMYSLIWMHLLSPLSKRATEIMSLLKTTCTKTVLPIVVTDKIIKDKMPIQADLFVEPLTKETVERLCLNVKENNSRTIQNLPSKQPTIHNITSTPESTISSASGRTSIGSPTRNHSPPRWCRVEHATKEKQRRERIKDSCDQLRVLLPYVKGRKTDMASILEMTVDYLKIVNSALSQDFHSQVIDIMSSGSPPLEDDYFSMNMAYKKSIQKDKDNMDATSSEKSFHSVLTKTETKATKTSKEVNLNKRMVTRSLSRSLTAVGDEINPSTSGNVNKGRQNAYGNINNRIIVSKRGSSTAKVGSSNPKKPHITSTPHESKQSSTYETSATSLKDHKTENIIEDQPSQNHLYHNLPFPHMFTEGDISANRLFSSGHVSGNDGFAYISHSQINLQSSHNTGDRPDVNNYGGNVYFDGTYLPYSYSNLQDSNNGNYYGTEYVNPNAVLPVTSYTPRVSAFASGRKFERSTMNTEMLQSDAADVFNNNTLQ